MPGLHADPAGNRVLPREDQPDRPDVVLQGLHPREVSVASIQKQVVDRGDSLMSIPLGRDLDDPLIVVDEDEHGHMHVWRLVGYHDGKPVYKLAMKKVKHG